MVGIIVVVSSVQVVKSYSKLAGFALIEVPVLWLDAVLELCARLKWMYPY